MSEFPTISPLPDPPQRNEPESQFVSKANAWVAAQPSFRTQVNAAGEFVEASAGQAVDARDGAIDARQGAEAARDAALEALPIYASVAAGLGATDSGEFFRVIDGQAVLIYLNDNGTAVQQALNSPSSRVIGTAPTQVPDNDAINSRGFAESVESVSMSFAGSTVAAGLRVIAAGWKSGTEIGGGIFVGRTDLPKTLHDGGKYISPTVPPVSEQPGADFNGQIENFNAGVGETDSGGNGVYVRTDPILSAQSYGAQFDGSDDTAAIASFGALPDPKGSQLVEGSAISPTLTEDVDNITASGLYYTDGTSAKRPLDESGTVTHIQVDTGTATQQYVTLVTNQALFRSKVAGTWGVWQLISSQDIFTTGWPTISGDNVITEISTGTTAGWDVQSGSLTTDGSNLTFSNNGTRAQADRSITGPVEGDYLIYMTLRSDSIAGSYVNVNLGGVGAGKVTVSLGYNWDTSSAEVSRISARFNTNGVAGPTIDYSAQDVELALLCNAEFGSGTLYIKEAGAWVAYGAVNFPDPYAATIGVTQGGDQQADLVMKEYFVAKPNIVAVGDSVTEGATLYSPDPADGLTEYESTWMAHAQIYGDTRNSVIVNKGIGSQDSSQIAARMSRIMSESGAKVVFLSAANNDFGAGFSPAQRTANIQSSVDTIVSAGAKVALYNAVYPSSDNAGFPTNGDYYRDWWESESQNIAGVSIKVDWMQGDIMDGDYMDTAFTQPDGVHPNPAGYELLGSYIESLEP